MVRWWQWQWRWWWCWWWWWWWCSTCCYWCRIKKKIMPSVSSQQQPADTDKICPLIIMNATATANRSKSNQIPCPLVTKRMALWTPYYVTRPRPSIQKFECHNTMRDTSFHLVKVMIHPKSITINHIHGNQIYSRFVQYSILRLREWKG